MGRVAKQLILLGHLKVAHKWEKIVSIISKGTIFMQICSVDYGYNVIPRLQYGLGMRLNMVTQNGISPAST